MKTKLVLLLALAIIAAAPTPLFAQFFGGKGDPTAQLKKLFGAANAFSGTAVMTLRDKNGKITTTTETEMALADGKLRTEFDLTKVKGSDTPDQNKQEREMLQAIGISRAVTIARPDKKVLYMVFPNIKSYYEEPLKEPPTQTEETKIEKKELGREIVDGHPCIKSQVIITSAKGERVEATIWEATDLKNFPIRSQYNLKDGSVVANFKNLKLDKPADTLFEPPADAAKFSSMQDLMQGVFMQQFQKK